MGSKKVKGIVFYGDKSSDIANPSALKNYIQDLRNRGKENAGVKAYRKFGTPMMVAMLNNAGAFPTKYWSQGQYEDWEKIDAETLLKEFKVKSHACPNCILACGKVTTSLSGPHKGLTVEGPEYETIYAFGGLCCINKLDEILYLNDLCDRYGIDTITTGNLCAFAIEAAQRGKLRLNISYGDAQGVAELVTAIAERKGVGELLAEGIITASKELGLEDIAVHVKGMEPSGYDPRILKGMGLAYAVSPRGACHLRATFYKPELSGVIDKETVEGKAKLFIEYEDRLALFDTMIECRFLRDLLLWEDLVTIHNAIIGEHFSEARLKKVAVRVINTARHFNINAGLTRSDDTLPEHIFNFKIGDPKKNITRDELKYMVDDYYSLRNWDEQGIPNKF